MPLRAWSKSCCYQHRATTSTWAARLLGPRPRQRMQLDADWSRRGREGVQRRHGLRLRAVLHGILATLRWRSGGLHGGGGDLPPRLFNGCLLLQRPRRLPSVGGVLLGQMCRASNCSLFGRTVQLSAWMHARTSVRPDLRPGLPLRRLSCCGRRIHRGHLPYRCRERQAGSSAM